MDKRIGYIQPSKNGGDGCACTFANGDPCHWKGDECESVAFVKREDLSSLESQLATANEAGAVKDEVIKSFLVVVDHGCLPGTCGNQLFGDLCDLDETDCLVLGVVEFAKAALSQAPAAAAQLAEEAAGVRRVEELVADIRERLTRQNCEPISILTELDKVIGQAKAGGEPHA